MTRMATESDIPHVRSLMKFVPGFWHKSWRDDALERGIRAADGLAFVWDDGGRIVGFVCARETQSFLPQTADDAQWGQRHRLTQETLGRPV